VLATVYRNPLFLELAQYGTRPPPPVRFTDEQRAVVKFLELAQHGTRPPPPVRFTDEQRAVVKSSGYLLELFGRKASADQPRS
jgi:hypothetical protein